MGLSDIDEEDPPTVPPQAQQRQQPPVSAPAVPNSAAPSPPAGGMAKKGFDLDDLFSGMGVAGNATSSGGSAFASPSDPVPAPATRSTASAPADTLLDSIFAGSPVSASNPSPSPTGSVGSCGAQTKLPTAGMLYVDDFDANPPDNGMNLFDTSKPVEKQKFSTAESLLEAFSRQGKRGGSSRFDTNDSLDRLTKNKDDNKVRARLLALMDYYDVLGVAHTATEEEIRRSYKKKALELHPDRVGRDQTPEEAELFKTITKANEVLTDPEKKAAYDRQLCSGGVGIGAGRGVDGDLHSDLEAGGADWLSHWQRPQ